jgi:hypothetical protein
LRIRAALRRRAQAVSAILASPAEFGEEQLREGSGVALGRRSYPRLLFLLGEREQGDQRRIVATYLGLVSDKWCTKALAERGRLGQHLPRTQAQHLRQGYRSMTRSWLATRISPRVRYDHLIGQVGETVEATRLKSLHLVHDRDQGARGFYCQHVARG